MVYLIVDEEQMVCKIGYSDNSYERLKQLQTSNPNKLIIVSIIEGDIDLEQSIHNKFKNYHIKREWFYFSEDILFYFNDCYKRTYPELIINDTTVANTAIHYLKRLGIMSFNLTSELLEILYKEGKISKLISYYTSIYCVNPQINLEKLNIVNNHYYFEEIKFLE